MKKILMGTIKNIYYWITFRLLNKTVLLMEKGTILDKDDVYELLRSLPNETDKVIFQTKMRGLNRIPISIPLEIRKPFLYTTWELEGEETVEHANVLDAIIGEKPIKGPQCISCFPLDTKKHYSIIHIEWISSNAEMCGHILEFRKRSFSLNDIGMNMLTITYAKKDTGEIDQEYVIKWVKDPELVAA